MQQEIEAKFLNQNHDEIRRKLTELGAVCKYPTRLIRRTVFDFPDRRLRKKEAWVRLREELDGTIELLLKQVVENSIGQIFESTVIVNDYESAKQFSLSIGLEVKGQQETKRELWLLDETEIMLDEWPWVPPFIEIEAHSEEEVKNLASKLGLNWADAKFGDVTPVYVAEYGITSEEFIAMELSMEFNKPVPSALKVNKK